MPDEGRTRGVARAQSGFPERAPVEPPTITLANSAVALRQHLMGGGLSAEMADQMVLEWWVRSLDQADPRGRPR